MAQKKQVSRCRKPKLCVKSLHQFSAVVSEISWFVGNPVCGFTVYWPNCKISMKGIEFSPVNSNFQLPLVVCNLLLTLLIRFSSLLTFIFCINLLSRSTFHRVRKANIYSKHLWLFKCWPWLQKLYATTKTNVFWYFFWSVLPNNKKSLNINIPNIAKFNKSKLYPNTVLNCFFLTNQNVFEKKKF